jgi:hypothetical protein
MSVGLRFRSMDPKYLKHKRGITTVVGGQYLTGRPQDPQLNDKIQIKATGSAAKKYIFENRCN